MDSEVLLDAGVVTRCRRRVHLEHDPSMRDVQHGPPDPGVEQRIADAADHRRTVADQLSTLLGDDWVEIPRDAGRRAREEATLTAMNRGARFVSQPQFPADAEGGRRGLMDLLVQVDDGYVPVLVVRHKTTDPGAGAVTSPLPGSVAHATGDLSPRSAAKDAARKPRAQPRDQLRLAHAVRMLEACGMRVSGSALGGVIGVEADVVVWHDLESASWPGGRSALQEYDARFADRLAVASAAARQEEPLAQASRITECKGCPWWPTCEVDLHAARDVSLVVRGEDAALLRAGGVSTVDALADLSATDAESVPLAATKTSDAILLAKAWLHELPLVRRVRHVEVPRGDVEIDVDMESYADSGAYMWGCWLSGVDIGDAPGYRAFCTWDPLPTDDEARSFAEFWTWFSAVRRRTHEQGLTFRAYCYNELAENRWMLGSAERFAGKPGIPPLEEVREFIASDDWIDLFASVRDQFLCPNGKGLKVIAPSAGFAWRDPEASGENSMRWYRDAVALDGGTPEESQRERLLTYNEDDVRATWTIRRWMTSDAAHEIPFSEDL